MKCFYIATNRAKDPTWEFTERVKSHILKKGGKCYSSRDDEGTARDLGHTVVALKDDVECVIALGGDGTMLQVARAVNDAQVPVIGINMGTMGFLTELSVDTFEEGINVLMDGRGIIEHRMMLYGKIIRDGRPIFTDTALNDLVISREGNPKMINLRNYVNGRLLNKYRADGIIVATATGSTGYSLSAGGPIVSPETDLFVLRALAPQSMVYRSIILPPENEIVVELGADKYGLVSEATVSFDGEDRFPIRSGDSVHIKRSNKDTLFAKVYDTGFLDVLYKKMNPAWETEEM